MALGRIRWDRVGRVALLCVLVGILLLYLRPLHSYLTTIGDSKERQAEVARLEREHRALKARAAELRLPGTLEREARKLGYVRPGEKSYVIEDLPKGP